MLERSNLCAVCRSIFNTNLDSLTVYPVKPHHVTEQSFREAVDEECFICLTVWRSINAFTHTIPLSWTSQWTFSKELDPDSNWISNLYVFDIIVGDIEGVSFYLAPAKGDEIGKFMPASLGSITSSSMSLEIALNWYSFCRESHKKCRHAATHKRWLPTRLLDIGTKDEQEWKLFVTSQDELPSSGYMTLSYRWGNISTPWKLLSTNEHLLQAGQPVANLPQTFRDFILIARLFGIRYVWIDSLCIMQDSHEDWARESAKMQDVYSNSACCVAAAASSDPDGGLFRSRKPTDVQPGLVRMEVDGRARHDFFMLDLGYMDRQVTNAPLHQRGWAFQERLLAPRILHFTEHQIFWECCAEQKCEAFPTGIPYGETYGRRLKDYDQATMSSAEKDAVARSSQEPAMNLKILNLWRDWITVYSKCSLTLPADKLVALSGLSNLVRRWTGDEYVAGMWRSRLRELLGWSLMTPTKKPEAPYRAPSWSWASLDSPIEISGVSATTYFVFEVLDVRIDVGINPTGEVFGGYIRLQGHILDAVCLPKFDSREGYGFRLKVGRNESTLAHMDVLGSWSAGAHFKILPTRCEATPEVVKDTKYINLSGLILKDVRGRPGVYERAGLFTVRSEDDLADFGVKVDVERETAVLRDDVSPTVIDVI